MAKPDSNDANLFGQLTSVLGVLVLVCYAVLCIRCLGCKILARLSKAGSPLATKLSRLVGTCRAGENLDEERIPTRPFPVREALMKSDYWKLIAKARRLDYSRLLLQVMVHVGAVMLTYVVVARYTCGWSDPECTGDPSADSISLIAPLIGLSIFFVFNPQHFTYSRRDLLHCLTMARLAWQVWCLENMFMVVFQRYTMLALRTALGIILGNLPLTIVLNVAYASLASWTYLRLRSGDEALAERVFGERHVLWFIFDEAFSTMVLSAVCFAIENRTTAEAHATAKMRVSKMAEFTLHSILESVCDAVVHVSADFDIIHGAPSIDSLLLRAGGRQVERANLLEVVDQKDRQRFCENLAKTCCKDAMESSHPKGPADWILVNIVDACGVRVNAQIWHTALMDANYECLGFLLGIRELSAEECTTHNQSVRSSTASSVGDGNEVIDTGTFAQQTSMRSCIRSIASEGSSQQADVADVLLHVVEGGQDTAIVWFRADDLTILRGTAAFAVLGGPSAAGSCFGDWLLNKADVLSQLQERINDALYEDVSEPLVVNEVVLRVPRRRQVQHSARCTFVIEKSIQEASISIENVVVKAVLDSIVSSPYQRPRSSRRKLAATKSSL
mmetsp:Transcript_21272/g.49345  ORF Transcript_21272/g.49345 Transcript_21272/m.49345 type:complete len:617 (-) Transcript_21272:43-1893(-)